MGRYGTHFGRLNSWWKFVPAWIDYLSRSQFLLQQGKTVTDIGFLFYNDIRYSSPGSMTKTPDGVDYMACYPKNLKDMECCNGQIVVPNGPSFKVLVLPDHPFMSLEALQQIRRLIQAGATVAGNPPVAPPGLQDFVKGKTEFDELVSELWGGLDENATTVKSIGNGTLFLAQPLEQIGQQINLLPDIRFTPTPEDGTVRYIHRRVASEDVYFIANQTDDAVAFDTQFRVTGKTPELWDPATGQRWDAPRFVVNEATTNLS